MVFERLVHLLQQGIVWSGLWLTLLEIIAAFAIAAVTGLLAGFWCSRTPLRGRVAEPLFAWGYLAPLILFYPLFILWIGIGPWSKVVYAGVNAFFPVALLALRGFRAIDQRYVRVAHAFGASKGQTDRLVKIQAALPMVMAALRIGFALAIIGVILTEMLAAERGLGYELARASQTLQSADAFALIAILVAVVAVLQLTIDRVGRAPHQD
jgi:ABC-type nitrate/sulfonate/bicarbonate transport system permease component